MGHRIVDAVRRRLASGERGSASVFVVGMVVVLFALAGLVADGGRAINARVEIMDDAEQAARSGANQIDVNSLRGAGSATIDPVEAQQAATAFLTARGYQAGRITVTADAQTVDVVVQDTVPTSLLQLAFIDSFEIEGSATARAALGINDEITGAP
ncbi:pilus assembly protein TadG-related protein [Cellulomonas sp. P5_C5]